MTQWPDGYAEVILDTVDSTNQEARRRASEGTPPTWIMARAQTAGRGRRGRDWVSGAGNLYATLLIERHAPAMAAARLSFHAALAVADTLRVLAPDASIAVKWPNDVLLNGRKASGILLDALGASSTPPLMLGIGIGMNLATAPEVEEAHVRPTSVAAETGSAPVPEHALSLLARRIDHWLTVDDTQGFAPVREAWRARAIGIGQPIDVRLPGSTLSGTFRDVDADGLLVLETAEGLQTVAAGDVFFPGTA
ncbi:MAG: biotin--[acetyl-CoA-carboxylase] ligase [Pseudomonadota bacterium]